MLQWYVSRWFVHACIVGSYDALISVADGPLCLKRMRRFQPSGHWSARQKLVWLYDII